MFFLLSRFRFRVTALLAVLLLVMPRHSAFADGPPIGASVDSPMNASLLSTHIEYPGIPPGPWRRREIAVTALAPGAGAPKIDGRIDEECWRGATRAVGFFRSLGTSPVTEETEAWLFCDRKHLYIAFHCLDSDMSRIRASQTQRNGDVGGDDHVGIDIDSQNTHRGYSTFRVSARGTQAEYIEGGTADNITWVGDWHAAVQRTPDGWTCEMEIPFQLLRYPKGTKAFGLVLFRRLARESSREVWPYLPPDGDSNEAQYLHSFTGIEPPMLRARPVFLPYVLTTAGTSGGSRAREGMDIKYPLTTTLTGVATYNPDFQTIEQSVSDISFSYTEKYLPDHRPFFAEGSGFLPYRDQLYSLRIGQIDGGLKVVGKQKDISVGVLGTSFSGTGDDPDDPRQQVLAAQLRKDFSPTTWLLGNAVRNRQGGTYLENRTMKFEGGWSTLAPLRYHPNAQFDILPSWQGGAQRGTKLYWHMGTGAPGGRPNTGINITSTPDDFVSDLGYNPDLNQRGYNAWVEQYNDFDQGPVQSYWAGFNFSRRRSVRPDVFFSDYQNPEVYIEMRRGWAVDLSYNQSRRETYRDHTTDYDLSWGRRTLFQRGGAHLSAGQVADQSYRYFNLNQGIQPLRPLTLNLSQSWSSQGSTHQTQTVLTGTYRLTDTRTLGMRFVRQTGSADPASGTDIPTGNNIYVSYARHVRAGYDLFVLIGDPNAITTKGSATVKILQPF